MSKSTRRFYLYRRADETGVSGTGRVAEGALFPSGRCALACNTAVASVAVYDSIEDVRTIHGHNMRTLIVWVDPTPGHDEAFARAQMTAAQDTLEGAPLASIGGSVEAMGCLDEPWLSWSWVTPENAHAFIEGYISGAVASRGIR